jgi:anti-sigma regulatory factor (Ser/Thr protein kinase)
MDTAMAEVNWASEGSEQAPRRIPARPAALGAARKVLEEAMRRAGWEGPRAAEVVLAASEAVENAIEHGSVPGAPIDLEVEATPTALEVCVTDEGRPGRRTPEGEPSAPPPSSLRGRGRLIMRRLADRHEERRANGGTQVRLVFRSPRRPVPRARA